MSDLSAGASSLSPYATMSYDQEIILGSWYIVLVFANSSGKIGVMVNFKEPIDDPISNWPKEEAFTPVTFLADVKVFGLALGMVGHHVLNNCPEYLDVATKLIQDFHGYATAEGVDVMADYQDQEHAYITVTYPKAACHFISEYAHKEIEHSMSEEDQQEMMETLAPEMVKMLSAVLAVESNLYDVDEGADDEMFFEREMGLN